MYFFDAGAGVVSVGRKSATAASLQQALLLGDALSFASLLLNALLFDTFESDAGEMNYS